MLEHFESAQLRSVIAIVSSMKGVEKIVLLAAESTGQGYDTIFESKEIYREKATHYWLLVMVENNSQRNADGWQDMIENHCRKITTVTALIITTVMFNQWLQSGHSFAKTVYEDGFLCYDTGNTTLTEPAKDVSGNDLIGKTCRQFNRRSEEFLAGAEMYNLRKEYRLAAFLLHQAAEQAYISIIWMATGFRPNSHNLERLHRYALPFSAAITNIFPMDTAQEEELFRLLRKAYIDARYDTAFSVNGADVLRLMEKVKKLLEAAVLAVEEKEPAAVV